MLCPGSHLNSSVLLCYFTQKSSFDAAVLINETYVTGDFAYLKAFCVGVTWMPIGPEKPTASGHHVFSINPCPHGMVCCVLSCPNPVMVSVWNKLLNLSSLSFWSGPFRSWNWTCPLMQIGFQSIKNKMANRVDPDEMARHEPSNLDLQFTWVLLFSLPGLKGSDENLHVC